MSGHLEKVKSFGKRSEAIDSLPKKLHALGGLEAETLDTFLGKMQSIEQGMIIEKTVADTALLVNLYRDTIAALAEHGHTVTEEQLEAYFENR
jgi:hypothetical protein